MHKREFLKVAGLAGVAALANPKGLFAAEGPETLPDSKAPFTLPELPYATDALEPHIDKLTMEIHHGKHHKGYVDNLNKALNGTVLASLSLEDILAKVSAKESAVRNNAGGHYNHSLFWTVMSPQKTEPSAKLSAAINSAFGSLDAFKTKFSDAAKGVFGSGWAWLIVGRDKKLAVTSTPNQDNPLMKGLVKETGTPVLGLDVWEHAYYLKHQNKRPDYIAAFWDVVNWAEVEKRYEAALK
ncbi:superoxide dismutase [Chitinophaga cymbidii]|uniref:Superoxide dismutase n=1 Tax=Chitinophaga cymbidii TaxID=1096750 RepID=A0A512RJ81_9BACT|nr:superoxide dismutase [Chitinophaga cymbidii]GEP95757.1 superoxide dismutase [Mn] [Chitinophaga cymbidii]